MNRKQSLAHKRRIEQGDLLGIANSVSSGRPDGADLDVLPVDEVVGDYKACRGDFSAACEQCGEFLRCPPTRIFARASGEPFRAYACEPCARSRPLYPA